MFVRRVVIADDVQRFIRRRLRINLLQELEPFLVGVMISEETDDLALCHIQCGKKRRRTVSLIIVRHRSRATRLYREARLRSIESLNLAFLVSTKDDRVFGR